MVHDDRLAIQLVTAVRVEDLPTSEISAASVGAKAAGLSTVPPAWSLPFFVISSSLYLAYRTSGFTAADWQQWIHNIRIAAIAIGLRDNDTVLVRSSAVAETLAQRGRFVSEAGRLADILALLQRCCDKLSSDPDTKSETIFLLVQARAQPVVARGHLSNERRVSEEQRDWVCETEFVSEPKVAHTEAIAIRKWREGVEVNFDALNCNYAISITTTLRRVARWGSTQTGRHHFEWVWDGAHIFVVQDDMASHSGFADPRVLATELSSQIPTFQPRAIRQVTASDGSRFNKVHNVLLYRSLGLANVDIYILEDPALFESLLHNEVPNDLTRDLESLLKRPLVIRTDIDAGDVGQRQMLPRSDGVRTLFEAIDFLRRAIQQLRAEGLPLRNIAFLLHNFIPSVASAWSYADPTGRKVLISSLWGIPEGLYYYAHDDFVVDLGQQASDVAQCAQPGRYSITRRIRFKRNFVAPNADGAWVTQEASARFDWRPSLTDNQVRAIASDSCKIARAESCAVNIMWFAGTPKRANLPQVIPWYHEESELASYTIRHRSKRKKHYTDQEYVIHNTADVERLARLTSQERQRIKTIGIDPQDDSLLRNKEFARAIGQHAKALGAVVELNGSILSHTYYILCRTGAAIEVASPLDEVAGVKEFNKLVRDKIPAQIESVGERVSVRRLTGDALVRALREKLVEEAIEALDATGQAALVEELADVLEVIEALRKLLGVTNVKLAARRREKAATRGSFSEGFALLETQNPTLEERLQSPQKSLDLATSDVPSNQNGAQAASQVGTFQRSIDRRVLEEKTEQMLTWLAPLISSGWEVDGGEIVLKIGDLQPRLRPRIVAKREGANMRFDLKVVVLPVQFDLPLDIGREP